jgi:mannose-6-phosphate isomerase-like protein (cupin superfamily)
MKFGYAPLLLALAVPLAAQQPPPSQMIDAKTLRATGDDLLRQATVAKDGIAYKILLNRPDGNEQIAVRVKSGQGEWHHDFADVMIVLEGHARIVTGGEVVNGKQTAPGEIRGDGVKGGTTQEFGPGDTIRIEAQVPHQILLAPGTTSFRYFVVKLKDH